MNQNRPKLIRIVGIIELLRSLAGLVISFLGMGFLSVFVFQGSNIGGIFNASLFSIFLTIVSLIVSVVAFIAAIAVIRYKPLGRRLIIVVAASMIILNIVQNTFTIFSTGRLGGGLLRGLGIGGLGGIFGILLLALSFFPIIYYGALIYYFKTNEVRNAFQANANMK